MSIQQTIWVFFGFSGRLSRQAYALAGLLLYVIRLYPVYRIIGAQGNEPEVMRWVSIFLFMICILTITHIALTVKRLHDFDRTGWWSLVFLIGDIFAFILFCVPQGTPGPNRYGQTTNAPR